MLAPGVGLFVDFGLADHVVAPVESLYGHEAPAVPPGGEAVARLRLLDDFAARESPRTIRHQQQGRRGECSAPHVYPSASSRTFAETASVHRTTRTFTIS